MVDRFEDLIAWQKSRQLTSGIYRLTSRGRLATSYALRDQMERASLSIMANIAEGFDRYRAAEFLHFLDIAKGSTAELRSHLYVALDTNLISEKVFDAATERTIEVSRLIAGLITSLRRASKAKVQARTSSGLRTPDSGLRKKGRVS